MGLRVEVISLVNLHFPNAQLAVCLLKSSIRKGCACVSFAGKKWQWTALKVSSTFPLQSSPQPQPLFRQLEFQNRDGTVYRISGAKRFKVCVCYERKELFTDSLTSNPLKRGWAFDRENLCHPHDSVESSTSYQTVTHEWTSKKLFSLIGRLSWSMCVSDLLQNLILSYESKGKGDTSSNSAVLKLAKGDEVWLRMGNGALHGDHQRFSTFAGFLLFETK